MISEMTLLTIFVRYDGSMSTYEDRMISTSIEFDPFSSFSEIAKNFSNRVQQIENTDAAGLFEITYAQRLQAVMTSLAEFNEQLKDMRDYLIKAAAVNKISQRETARALKISTTTVNKALNRDFDAELIEALANEKPDYYRYMPNAAEKDDGKKKDETKNPIRRRPKNRQQSKKN